MIVRPLALVVTALAGFAAGVLTLDLSTHRDGNRAIEQSSHGNQFVPTDRGTDSIALAIGVIRGRNDLRALADLGSALETLDASQIGRVLDQVDREPNGRAFDCLQWLFEWWMKRDPNSATAWFLPRLDRFTDLGATGTYFSLASHGKLMKVWLKAKPEAALDFALAHSGSGLAISILHALDPKALGKSDGEWFALLATFPECTHQRELIAEMLAGWAERDTSAALAAAQSLPSPFAREQALSAVLKRWSATDASAAIAEYRKLAITDSILLSSMLANAMQKDRAKALALLGELDTSDFARCAPSLVDAWAKSDPVAALSWALEHGVPVTSQAQLRSCVVPSFLGFNSTAEFDQVTPIVSAMEANASATLAWIRSLPSGPDRNRLLLLAIPLSKVPLSDSIALLPELPPEWASQAAYSLAFRFAEDPEAGRAWAESLPDGPVRSAAWQSIGARSLPSFDLPPGSDRDALLLGRAFGNGVQSDPATSFGVTMQITDPTLRRDALDLGMHDYLKGDHTKWAGEARAWLENADIPEEWKQRWR